MPSETPENRVDELTNEQCREILTRITEAVEAHRLGRGWRSAESIEASAHVVVQTLRDWSLID